MNTRLTLAALAAVVSVALVGPSGQTAPAPPVVAAPPPVASPAAAVNAPLQAAAPVEVSTATAARALVDQYCATCHNVRMRTANLLLDELDLENLGEHAEIGEEVIRMVRAGLMPPAGMPRPVPEALEGLITWMENEIDRTAATHLPPPGLHRLNRTEYSNAIRDLLALEVNAADFLPADDSSHGFDNIAGSLTMSPALMEAYLSAASKISRLAIGSETAPKQMVFDVPADTSQNHHIEGLPFGTRGGMLIPYEFPADGEYVFTVKGVTGYFTRVLGQIEGEQLILTVDGQQVHQFDWDREISSTTSVGARSPSIPISAGLHMIGVTFLATNDLPATELNRPFERTTNSPGDIPGFMFYPHVGQVFIDGPFNGVPATNTPSRDKIFVCRPQGLQDEGLCAREIISTLTRSAYRRPADAADLEVLMDFYLMGREEGGSFDAGIQAALQRILADPEFIYRSEPEPVQLAEHETYRISDMELASRLSFFLWSSIPDDELIDLAGQGRLQDPAVLEAQVRRMLADPRSGSLVRNFTGQWLNVRSLEASEPVVELFPDWDSALRAAFRQEIELFFDSIIREDRSVLDMLTADYTFVNERLARHYDIPNVYGPRFRRVTLGPELQMRHGLLGKGALLTITSQAARTSPVLRGKWFLQTFLGVSPPDPPPGVETDLSEAGDPRLAAPRTLRDRLEAHRANPVCAACHNIFEPMGLAMENFDAVGRWRTLDEGIVIDASGVIPDGTPLAGIHSLREVLTRYSDQFAQVVTEKLLTYALGRGVEYQDMPLVRQITRNAAANDYHFSSLVWGIVQSPAFQMNMKMTGTAPQQAAR